MCIYLITAHKDKGETLKNLEINKNLTLFIVNLLSKATINKRKIIMLLKDVK